MAAEEGAALVAMDDDGVYDVAGDRPGKPLAIRGIQRDPRPDAAHAEGAGRAPRPRALPLAPPAQDAPVRGHLRRHQGHAGHGDAVGQRACLQAEVADAQGAQGVPSDTKAAGQEDRALYVSSLRVFAERMVDVLEISAPDAVLGDGAPAMGGDGFQVSSPTAEMVAIGGTNPVRGRPRGGGAPRRVEQPRARARARRPQDLAAHRRRREALGLDLKATAITGDGADLLKSPRPVHYKAMAPFRLDWEPGQAPLPGGPAKGLVPAPPASQKAPGGEQGGGSDGGPAKPEAHASPLPPGEKIVLDGKADDAAWGRAKAVQWDTDYAGKRTGFPTRARFLWSKQGSTRSSSSRTRGSTRIARSRSARSGRALQRGLHRALPDAGPGLAKAVFRGGDRAVRPFLRYRHRPRRAPGRHGVVERRDDRDEPGRARAHGRHRGAADGAGDRGRARPERAAAHEPVPDGGQGSAAVPRVEPAPHEQAELPCPRGVWNARDRSPSRTGTPADRFAVHGRSSADLARQRLLGYERRMPIDLAALLRSVELRREDETTDPGPLSATWEDPAAFRRALFAFAAERTGTLKSRAGTAYDVYADAVLRHAASDRIAFVEVPSRGAPGRLRFSELHARASALAAAWTPLGVKPGAAIAIVLPPGVAGVVALAAALYAGACVSWITPKGDLALAAAMEALAPAHVVLDPKAPAKVGEKLAKKALPIAATPRAPAVGPHAYAPKEPCLGALSPSARLSGQPPSSPRRRWSRAPSRTRCLSIASRPESGCRRRGSTTNRPSCPWCCRRSSRARRTCPCRSPPSSRPPPSSTRRPSTCSASPRPPPRRCAPRPAPGRARSRRCSATWGSRSTGWRRAPRSPETTSASCPSPTC